jgi:hypothetical protein
MSNPKNLSMDPEIQPVNPENPENPENPVKLEKPEKPAISEKPNNIIQSSKRFLARSSSGFKQVHQSIWEPRRLKRYRFMIKKGLRKTTTSIQRFWGAPRTQAFISQAKRTAKYAGLSTKRWSQNRCRRTKQALHIATAPQDKNAFFLQKIHTLELENKQLRLSNQRLNTVVEVLKKDV